MVELGPGERAERAKQRRIVWALVGAGLAGAAAGVLAWINDVHLMSDGEIPPGLAIALTLSFLLVVPIASYFMWRNLDEHGRLEHLWYSFFGAGVFVIAYPAWYLLWKGRLAPEPDHVTLFLIFYAGVLLGYLVRRFRPSR